MKKIAKFLLAVFCFMPTMLVAAPIAQTAGSNLTGYNGTMGGVIGNQWNSMMNPRSNTQNTTVKADFGNCEAVILRCAKPRCSGGGCANSDVAKTIVSGCVSANSTCKKHGDDLIDYVSAQLVAESVAEQNNQAQAVAAANAAAEQNSAVMQQQMQAMQQQMAQMQEQNSAQIAQLQNALEESQRATADAVAAAANNATAVMAAQQQQTVAATVQNPNTGLTANQETAAKSGVDAEIISRATITGQILTSMEGVDQSLEKLKSTMRDAFRYAKCNEINGDNCEGPKRVKKFKELANKFFEPYDALVDNLDDALVKAQTVGVDMSDIYMMLSGTCNRWAKYICRYEVKSVVAQQCVCVNKETKDRVTYTASNSEVKCEDGWKKDEDTCKWVQKENTPIYDGYNCDKKTHKSVKGNGVTRGGHECSQGQVIPPEDLVACTVNEIFNEADGMNSVQEAWLNPDKSSTGIVRVGCASDVLNGGIFRRRGSARKGGVNIDILQYLINQDAPSNFEKGKVSDELKKWCTYDEEKIRSAAVSKTLASNICCEKASNSGNCNESCDDETKGYINPIYTLCSVHAYNADKTSNDDLSTDTKIDEAIALKSTVIAQQMYKQYMTIEAMIKRLKIQLEKSALKASLQVAGASNSGDDDNGASSADVQFDSCAAMDAEDALACVRGNYAKLKPYVDKGNLKNSIKKQIVADCKVLKNQIESFNASFSEYNACKDENSVAGQGKSALDPIESGIAKLSKNVNDLKRQMNNRSGFGGY